MDWIILFLLVMGFALVAVWARRKRASKGNWIVVDGSNVLYWDRETPDLQSVRHVVGILKSEGFDPVVWFDANVGYLIGSRFMGAAVLADALGLPRRQVYVAPKGTPADPLLLEGAEALGARVVTNDRFRDWEDRFPRIREDGFLVRGFITSNEIGLEWERGAAKS